MNLRRSGSDDQFFGARGSWSAPANEMGVDDEISFDPDIHASYLGRLLKVRETVNDEWRHGVPCFAETEWELEDYHGNGKMCKVEKPTGGYQLQWGLFEHGLPLRNGSVEVLKGDGAVDARARAARFELSEHCERWQHELRHRRR